MIQLKTDTATRFKIDNTSFAKDSVTVEYHPDGAQVRLIYMGTPVYEYQQYNTYVDGDNSNTPFANIEALRIYIDRVFYRYLPFAETYRLIAAASINATCVKAAPALLQSLHIINTGDDAVFIKLYDKATAPNPSTDTPVQTYMIPGRQIVGYSSEAAAQYGQPANTINLLPDTLMLRTGLGFVITGAAADNDETAIAAGVAILNMMYR